MDERNEATPYQCGAILLLGWCPRKRMGVFIDPGRWFGRFCSSSDAETLIT